MPLAQLLVLINLILQITLVAAVFTAVYLVKVKHQFIRHCLVIRIAVVFQVLAVAVVMLPSMIGFSQNEGPALVSRLELQAHALLGFLVLGLFIYFNLAIKGIIKHRRLVIPMRIALTAWLLSFILGLHIYFVLWV